MRRFDILIRDCDADIRANKPHLAAQRLARFGTARIPREWRLPIARICRRAGVFGQGLRLLSRPVLEGDASGAEITEYSALLLRSGAVGEALEKLKSVSPQEVPESLTVRAFAHFSRWEYAEAIPLLQEYLRSPLSADTALVGRSNLAMAFVESRRYQEAEQCLNENIRLAESQGYARLEAFNHAQLAKMFLQESDLKSAKTAIADYSSTEDWTVAGITMIIDAMESGDAKHFAKLREAAARRKDWSALRDADLFSLKIDFQMERFLHLFFGSPLPGFRECIKRELGRVPDRTVYVLGRKNTPRFDLETGEIGEREAIRPGFKCHQLLRVLLQDFYRPVRVGGLHAGLFPGEQFDISSSPDRVHQIVKRTRKWLAENHIPVSLNENDGFYSLVIDGAFSFRVPLHRPIKDLRELQIERLKAAFPAGRLFSTEDVLTRLEISMSAAHRLLQSAIESHQIERLGKVTRPAGYRFLEVEKRKAA